VGIPLYQEPRNARDSQEASFLITNFVAIYTTTLNRDRSDLGSCRDRTQVQCHWPCPRADRLRVPRIGRSTYQSLPCQVDSAGSWTSHRRVAARRCVTLPDGLHLPHAGTLVFPCEAYTIPIRRCSPNDPTAAARSERERYPFERAGEWGSSDLDQVGLPAFRPSAMEGTRARDGSSRWCSRPNS